MARVGYAYRVAAGFAVLLALSSMASAQNSCTAVAYLGMIGGTSCTGEELGDAKMQGAGVGDCDEVTNASCVLTEANEGDCAIYLYSDSSCSTPIGGGNTIMCGEPPQNVNFGSFEIECS